jgi:hypothetical protein
MTATKCKRCRAIVVVGASHCAHCGSPQGMRLEHRLLLITGFVVIVALFLLASRPPNQADVEYRPMGPTLEGTAAVDLAAPRASSDDPPPVPPAARPADVTRPQPHRSRRAALDE